ncbi:MAG: hypothetical protein Q9228_007539, partial [Teloschistes exilis]
PEDGPLLTVGDAICSFLKVPDTSTRGLASVATSCIFEKMGFVPGGLAILITGSIFLGSGIAGLENRKSPVDLKSLVKMGFGAVQPRAFVGLLTPSASTKSLYLSVVFSNIWQFVISLLYLAYNAVLTAMLVANEWDRFGETRKPLRVTEPQGLQRSTYSASVPLKYGIPVILSVALLHYTISQSVF